MDVERWCRVTVVAGDGTELGRWTLEGTGPPDLAAVAGVACLALSAARLGGRALIEPATEPMRRLLELAGLAVEVGG